MRIHSKTSTFEAEEMLRAAGWRECPKSRSPQTMFPGRACWSLHQDDPYSPDVFVADYGFVLEVPHGNLCPPSVLRFPRGPLERSFGAAFERLTLYVSSGEFWPHE